MSALDFLLPWDRQPQEAVEICRDYAPAFVWNPGIGLLIPALGDPLTLTGTGVNGVGIHGRTVDLSSGGYLLRGNYAPIVTSNGAWTGDFTALCIAAPSTVAAQRTLISQRIQASPYEQFTITANCSTADAAVSGKVLFRTYQGADTSVDASGITDGQYHVFGIRRIGTTVTGWVDGVQVASVTGTVRAIGIAGAGIGIGCSAPSFYTGDAVAIAFAAGFNTGIVDMADVSRNIWRATFAPSTIWVPVSAGGGGTTVAGSLGTAAASGITGSVDANRTIAGSVGVASALGIQGGVSQSSDTTVTGTVGVATASGIAGVVDANRTIAGALGVATASGLTGTVSNTNDTVVTGSVGTATASGVAGTVAWNRTLAGIVGEAIASGIAGGVQSGPVDAAPTGGGGYLPSFRRKTRKEIHAERVRLGILPEEIRKAAQKVVEKAAEQGDPEEVYEDNTEKYKAMFLREVGATKWAPDYARAIRIELELMERDAEDALLLM